MPHYDIIEAKGVLLLIFFMFQKIESRSSEISSGKVAPEPSKVIEGVTSLNEVDKRFSETAKQFEQRQLSLTDSDRHLMNDIYQLRKEHPEASYEKAWLRCMEDLQQRYSHLLANLPAVISQHTVSMKLKEIEGMLNGDTLDNIAEAGHIVQSAVNTSRQNGIASARISLHQTYDSSKPESISVDTDAVRELLSNVLDNEYLLKRAQREDREGVSTEELREEIINRFVNSETAIIYQQEKAHFRAREEQMSFQRAKEVREEYEGVDFELITAKQNLERVDDQIRTIQQQIQQAYRQGVASKKDQAQLQLQSEELKELQGTKSVLHKQIHDLSLKASELEQVRKQQKFVVDEAFLTTLDAWSHLVNKDDPLQAQLERRVVGPDDRDQLWQQGLDPSKMIDVGDVAAIREKSLQKEKQEWVDRHILSLQDTHKRLQVFKNIDDAYDMRGYERNTMLLDAFSENILEMTDVEELNVEGDPKQFIEDLKELVSQYRESKTKLDEAIDKYKFYMTKREQMLLRIESNISYFKKAKLEELEDWQKFQIEPLKFRNELSDNEFGTRKAERTLQELYLQIQPLIIELTAKWEFLSKPEDELRTFHQQSSREESRKSLNRFEDFVGQLAFLVS